MSNIREKISDKKIESLIKRKIYLAKIKNKSIKNKNKNKKSLKKSIYCRKIIVSLIDKVKRKQILLMIIITIFNLNFYLNRK